MHDVPQLQKIKRYYKNILVDEMTFDCPLDEIFKGGSLTKHKFYDLEERIMPTYDQLLTAGKIASENVKKGKILFCSKLLINDKIYYCFYEKPIQLRNTIIAYSKLYDPYEENALNQDLEIMRIFSKLSETVFSDLDFLNFINIEIKRKNFKLYLVKTFLFEIGKTFKIDDLKASVKKHKNKLVFNYTEINLGCFIADALTQKKESKENKEWQNPEKKLNSMGISDRKEWKKWMITNHPDKNHQADQDLFEKVVSAGRTMSW